MAHLHSLYDTDPHFMIDPVTREIKNMSGKVTIMQYDHNSERCTFELPREIDGHDMSLCNRVIVHYTNVDASTKDANEDCYEVEDLQISPNSEDESVVILSWLISDKATQYAGSLVFLIEFACIADDGTKDYAWHTKRHEGLSVGNGMNNGGNVVERYSDILLAWEARIFGSGDSVMADIEGKASEQMAAIEAKGAATLSTIPEDYTDLSELANDAARTRANAIVQTVEGESVTAADCSGDYLRGLRIFGKSTQDGTPSPDAPVDIVSVENAAVSVLGENMIDLLSVPKPKTYEYSFDAVTGIYKFTPPGAYAANRWTFPVKPHSTIYLSALDMSFGVTIQVSDFNQATTPTLDARVSDKGGVVEVYTGDYSELTFTIYASVEGTFEVRGVKVSYSSGGGYEPYKEPQTVEISRTLPGVPVSSGGNYTDANGQRWNGDVGDLGRGVCVHNIKELVLDGSADELWGYHIGIGVQDSGVFTLTVSNAKKTDKRATLCDSYIEGKKLPISNLEYWGKDTYFGVAQIAFRNDACTDVASWRAYLAEHPIKFMYEVETPSETALSDAETNAFKALHSNYPNTTVLNDAGAWMEVKYNADTQKFVANLPGATDEQIESAVNAYLDENPIESGATAEQAAQIAANTESIGDIETALDSIIAIQNELIGGGA